MQIIDGKKVSAQVKEEVKRQTLELKETHKITPGLAVVIVGDDPASRVYVNNKKKACEFVGFKSEEYALPAETTQEELLANSGEPDPDNIYTYQSDDSDYHSESYTYEKEAEKYYGNSSYKFEFTNDVLAYVTISYTP